MFFARGGVTDSQDVLMAKKKALIVIYSTFRKTIRAICHKMTTISSFYEFTFHFLMTKGGKRVGFDGGID